MAQLPFSWFNERARLLRPSEFEQTYGEYFTANIRHDNPFSFWQERWRELNGEGLLKKAKRAFSGNKKSFDFANPLIQQRVGKVSGVPGDILLALSGENEILENFSRLGRMLGEIFSCQSVERIDESSKKQFFHECLNSILYPGYKIEIRTGFGGSDGPVSIRIPGTIVPGLELLRALKKHSGKGVFQIFHAVELSAWTNGLDKSLAVQNAARVMNLSQKFVRKFYPDIEPWVEFTILSKAGLDEQARQIFAELRGVAQLPDFPRLKTEKDNATEYALWHCLIFGTIDSRGSSGCDCQIKVGGPTEQPFNQIQRFAAKNLSCRDGVYLPNTSFSTGNPIFVISRLSSKPAYYPTQEEITLNHLPVVESYSGEYHRRGLSDLARDLETIEIAVGPVAFRDWLGSL